MLKNIKKIFEIFEKLHFSKTVFKKSEFALWNNKLCTQIFVKKLFQLGQNI